MYTQLSQKEVGKYPIASNPYLELCDSEMKIKMKVLGVNKMELKAD